MKLIPNKKQFYNWTLPSRIGYIASVITIILFICYVFIGIYKFLQPIPIDNKEVNVLILRNNDIINVRDFANQLLKVGSKHKKGYELLHDVSLFFKLKNPRNIDKETIPMDLIEMSFWLWFSKKYHLHWQVVEKYFDGISGGGWTIDKAKNAEKKPIFINTDRLGNYLSHNSFELSKGQIWGISLPSDSILSIIKKSKFERFIKIENNNIIFEIAIISVGNSGVFGTTLGDTILKTLPTSSEWYSNNFRIEFKCSYNRIYRYTTRTKEMRKWINNIMNDFYNDFDWSLVEKDLKIAYNQK